VFSDFLPGRGDSEPVLLQNIGAFSPFSPPPCLKGCCYVFSFFIASDPFPSADMRPPLQRRHLFLFPTPPSPPLVGTNCEVPLVLRGKRFTFLPLWRTPRFLLAHFFLDAHPGSKGRPSSLLADSDALIPSPSHEQRPFPFPREWGLQPPPSRTTRSPWWCQPVTLFEGGPLEFFPSRDQSFTESPIFCKLPMILF